MRAATGGGHVRTTVNGVPLPRRSFPDRRRTRRVVKVRLTKKEKP